MKLFWLSLLILDVCYAKESEETVTEAEENRIMDKLAVNMVGAVVKTIFPEVTKAPIAETTTKTAEIRRAPPSNPFGPGAGAAMADYSNAGGLYNSLPQLGNQDGRNPFGYQSRPGYNPRTPDVGGSALPVGNLPQFLTAGGGAPEELNAVRNQQYLAQLAKHQSELNTYSAKQLEYLDQQRRYQQAMIDHQAGAALLMQKQQQEIINEQMKSLKKGYSDNQSPSDNTVGGKVLTRRYHGVKTYTNPRAPSADLTDDDMVISDARMKEYFRKEYGIEIPDDAGKLTEDERRTLRQLRDELLRQKQNAIDHGTFKTMSSMKSKLKHSFGASTSSERLASTPRESTCAQCIPMNIRKMRGAWTQIYGNPEEAKKKFGTLMTLEGMHNIQQRTRLTEKTVSCAGFEVGKYSKGEASLNYFYREDSDGHRLHEVSILVCVVKTGPSDADRYEYIVLSDVNGRNACRSYHVFARNTDEFNRRHFDDVSEFMKSEVIMTGILPVAAFPKASLCQLNRP